jgi:hypothetical protein
MSYARTLRRGLKEDAIKRALAVIAKDKANKALKAKVGDSPVKVKVGGQYGYADIDGKPVKG